MDALREGNAVTTLAWLRKRLRPAAHGWANECPAGLPVPTAQRCMAADCESVALPALAEGEHGRITCLQDPGGRAAVTLAALGALPGVELELLQRFPVFVFRIGQADVAVDTQLADHIRVRRIS